MVSTTEKITAWASTELRYWEQAALNLLLSKDSLGEGDYLELTECFLQEAGLAKKTRPWPRLPFVDGRLVRAVHAKCRLEGIRNLRGVNALPNDQEIKFGKQLTLIYGRNGAGKTGYARPLASAAFSRGTRQVLPDAGSNQPLERAQACIDISYGEVKETIKWTYGEPCPALSGFYVFDSESLVPHLCNENALSFSPAGLSILTRLAEVTDQVRDEIKQQIANREREQDFRLFFHGDSDVTALIANLNSRTDIDCLEKLSSLSSEEESFETQIKKQIAELQLLDVPKRVAKLGQEATDLENLVLAIAEADRLLGKSTEDTIKQLLTEVREQRNEVTQSGADQFKFEPFTKIGTPPWQAFLSAAKSLSDAESEGRSKYPDQGDLCLFCRQPLATGAVELIRRLWAFLESDAQDRLESAEGACSAKSKELGKADLNYFGPDSSVRRLLESELPLIVPQVDAHLESCRARRREMMNALSSFEIGALAPLTSVNSADLATVRRMRKVEIEELLSSNVGQQLTTATNSLRQLEHRRLLTQCLPAVRSYVDGLRWAERAREFLGTTRAITTEHNRLFEEIVTKRYTDLFEKTLKRFNGKMNLTIATRGTKGETVHQIVLNPKTYPQPFPIDRILSDGEKRVVAICDFLTEAAMDDRNSGIILDDPVTSLDDNWKAELAACLAEQAAERQVIVFTHDLTFLYLINTASAGNVDVVAHWIKEEEGKPGFVYLKNSPVCEKNYKSANIARDYYSMAKGLSPSEEQRMLQQGFGALRTSYEALIIFELFNEVVLRFEERISFGRLNDVRLDPELNRRIVERMEAISRFIEAHLHSDKFASSKPTRENLLQEIETFEGIRKEVQQLKKAN
jgi:hypothetical protein